MSNLKDLQTEDIRERLLKIKDDYKTIVDQIIPLLQKASLTEKEIDVLLAELQSR